MNFFTKPLQGSLFRKLCKIILNLPDEFTMCVQKSASGNELTDTTASQECVGTKRSYADVVRGTAGKSSNVTPVANMTDAMCQSTSTVNGTKR
jgi:hypothetical protein